MATELTYVIVDMSSIGNSNVLVKIGRTSGDPEVRRKSLQTGSPGLLTVAACSPIYKEREIHAEYQAYHHNNEWFSLPGEVYQELVNRFNQSVNDWTITNPGVTVIPNRGQRVKIPRSINRPEIQTCCYFMFSNYSWCTNKARSGQLVCGKHANKTTFHHQVEAFEPYHEVEYDHDSDRRISTLMRYLNQVPVGMLRHVGLLQTNEKVTLESVRRILTDHNKYSVLAKIVLAVLTSCNLSNEQICKFLHCESVDSLPDRMLEILNSQLEFDRFLNAVQLSSWSIPVKEAEHDRNINKTLFRVAREVFQDGAFREISRYLSIGDCSHGVYQEEFEEVLRYKDNYDVVSDCLRIIYKHRFNLTDELLTQLTKEKTERQFRNVSTRQTICFLLETVDGLPTPDYVINCDSELDEDELMYLFLNNRLSNDPLDQEDEMRYRFSYLLENKPNLLLAVPNQVIL